MKNLLRNMLAIRKPRRPLPSGPVPPVGASITLDNLRMAVNMPIPNELWSWLLLSGWRTVPVKKDRRKCVDLPPGTLLKLIQTPLAERDALHRRILEKYAE